MLRRVRATLSNFVEDLGTDFGYVRRVKSVDRGKGAEIGKRRAP